MKHTAAVIVGCVLGFFLPALPASAIRLLDTNAIPTVAILAAATDDVTRAAADLLQLRLLGDKNVKVVERAEIEKLLKEQTLAAAFGPGRVGERIQLGGILRADMLVFLERRMAEDGKHELMEVSAAETRMGLRVIRDLAAWNEKSKDQEIQRLASEVEKAVDRLRRGFNMLVAVPAFECRDISVDYLYLRKPYGHLVEQSLLARPGVLVVDIEDADALAREFFVSSSALQIERPLPYYLRGNYRNEGLGPDRTISVELTLEHGRSAVVTQRMDKVKESALAETFDGAVSKLVGKLAPSPARTRLAGQREARLLTEQGKTIRDTGSVQEAIPYFETASLLDELYAEPRLQLFMAYAELYVMASRNKAGLAEEMKLVERAFDCLETALPHWQGDLSSTVIGSFDDLASRLGMTYVDNHPELRGSFARLMERTVVLAAGILESSASLGLGDHNNIEGSLSYPLRRVSEFDPAGGVAARERLCHAYARRPEAFRYEYDMVAEWLDQDLGGALRSRLEKSDDTTTKVALRIYEMRKSVHDLDSLDREWPEVLALAGGDQVLKNALGLLRAKEIEPDLRPKEPAPVELYVDENLPRARLERLSLGETGKVRDWIIAGEYGEYFAAERGLFRVDALGQAKKVLDGDTGRLAWDGVYLWAVQEGNIATLDAAGAPVANVKSEDVNYSIHGSELKPVPLEPGWVCFIGNAEQNGTMRRWVTTLDVRDKNARKPIMDTLVQTTATRKEFMRNDWAVKWDGGPPYIVITRGAQINVSERTVSDFRRELNGTCPFDPVHVQYVPHETALVWGTNTFLIAGGRTGPEGWLRGEVHSAILGVLALGQEPRIWLMHPPGLNIDAGSTRRAHQAVFMADGWIHFILEPGMRPAWYATNPETRETRVVSYDLPKEIDFHRASFTAYPSKAFGVVVVCGGQVYRAKLPPPERWAFFGSPLEYHQHLVADPATIAHRLSAVTTTDVQQLVVRGGLDEQDEMGWTLVFYAVDRNDSALLNALLDAGADLKHTTRMGSTAVMFAAGRGHPEGLLALLKHGADPDYRPGQRPPALLEAVKAGHPDCVRILLDGGADPNIAEITERVTPLHSAAFRGFADSAEFLLKAGANPNTRNSSGHTPLHFAADRGHAEIVRLLLDHGADPSLTAPYLGYGGGMLTARDFARAAKHQDVLRVFDEHTGQTNHEGNETKE